jgi:hypothetical protein
MKLGIITAWQDQFTWPLTTGDQKRQDLGRDPRIPRILELVGKMLEDPGL